MRRTHLQPAMVSLTTLVPSARNHRECASHVVVDDRRVQRGRDVLRVGRSGRVGSFYRRFQYRAIREGVKERIKSEAWIDLEGRRKKKKKKPFYMRARTLLCVSVTGDGDGLVRILSRIESSSFFFLKPISLCDSFTLQNKHKMGKTQQQRKRKERQLQIKKVHPRSKFLYLHLQNLLLLQIQSYLQITKDWILMRRTWN